MTPADPPLGAAAYTVPVQGDLQLLALGEAGLRAWRECRLAEGETIPAELVPPPAPAPRPPSAPRPVRLPEGVPAGPRRAQRVLLVGWDAADWRVIDPLLAAGQMPALQRLLAGGVRGNVATLDPPYSPMLWTSIATGKTADEHGVLYFVEPNADGTGVHPVLGTSRKGKALWNVLSQAGLRSNVVGWWPSHPAEPIAGVMASNHFREVVGRYGEAWPVPAESVHPEEKTADLGWLRVHPEEITGAHVFPFIPEAAAIGEGEGRRLRALTRLIAHAATVHATATHLLRHEDWDLTAVYFDGLDHFSHAFMKFHPPQLPHVEDEAFARYRGVVTAAYRFFDLMLHRLLDLAGDDTAVVLVSDHGFHSGALRPRSIPKVPAGPAVEHRPYGIFALRGPGVQRGERVFGASLLDVTPTVLTLFGLPVGQDMRGRPLVQAFETPFVPPAIPSWEGVEGEAGLHPPGRQADPWAEEEAMRQLVELGYVEAPAGTAAERVAGAVRERDHVLARVYLSTGRPREALPILEGLVAASPEDARFALLYAHALRQFGRIDEARGVAEGLAERHGAEAPLLHVLRAELALMAGRAEEALGILEGLGPEAAGNLEAAVQTGHVYLRLRRPADAEAAFRDALAADPDSARAYHGLARALFALGRDHDAARASLDAVARLYFFPEAHYHLGLVLTRLGWVDRAVEAFQVCLAQAPTFHLAHRRLAYLHRDYLREPAKARAHWEAYRLATHPASGTPLDPPEAAPGPDA